MKKILSLLIMLIMSFSIYGQSIEITTSMHTSSEPRLDDALGIGLQYSNPLGQHYDISLGLHYFSNHAKFTEIPFNDADPSFHFVDRLNSYSNRISVRLNILRYLTNNDHYSIAVGPGISYNWLWGYDKVHEYDNTSSSWSFFRRDIESAADKGLGLLVKFELKNIITPGLSLNLATMPEVLVGKDYKIDGIDPVFSSLLRMWEFQVGLKYNYKSGK